MFKGWRTGRGGGVKEKKIEEWKKIRGERGEREKGRRIMKRRKSPGR